jgi:hypothetical protein
VTLPPGSGARVQGAERRGCAQSAVGGPRPTVSRLGERQHSPGIRTAKELLGKVGRVCAATRTWRQERRGGARYGSEVGLGYEDAE